MNLVKQKRTLMKLFYALLFLSMGSFYAANNSVVASDNPSLAIEPTNKSDDDNKPTSWWDYLVTKPAGKVYNAVSGVSSYIFGSGEPSNNASNSENANSSDKTQSTQPKNGDNSAPKTTKQPSELETYSTQSLKKKPNTTYSYVDRGRSKRSIFTYKNFFRLVLFISGVAILTELIRFSWRKLVSKKEDKEAQSKKEENEGNMAAIYVQESYNAN